MVLLCRLAFLRSSASQSRACPRCAAWLHKAEGCDKLKCRCGYRFCWRCGAENAQCACTPASHGFWDNVSNRGDFAALRGPSPVSLLPSSDQTRHKKTTMIVSSSNISSGGGGALYMSWWINIYTTRKKSQIMHACKQYILYLNVFLSSICHAYMCIICIWSYCICACRYRLRLPSFLWSLLRLKLLFELVA